MAYGDTRKRDIAIILIIAAMLAAGLYFFYFKKGASNTVQAADARLYLCEDSRSITALWLPGKTGEVVLRLSHSPKVYLSADNSANGSRYVSSDSKHTFWNQGEEASLTENGKVTYAECTMMKFQEDSQ